MGWGKEKVPAQKAVFADRMGDGTAKDATTMAREKRNSARCAMDLLKLHPTGDFPAENQCSYYCRWNCKLETCTKESRAKECKDNRGRWDVWKKQPKENPHNKNCHCQPNKNCQKNKGK